MLFANPYININCIVIDVSELKAWRKCVS